MTNQSIVVEGVVTPDGCLELKGKLPLPVGRVQVTVEPIPGAPKPERFWKLMESIWSDLKTGSRVPRTKEAIDAEVNALRQEAEEEMEAIETLRRRRNGCFSTQAR
jgi:hypothetical protein